MKDAALVKILLAGLASFGPIDIGTFLLKKGFHLYRAGSCQEITALVEEQVFAIIVVDLDTLPVGDLDNLKTTFANQKICSVPIIFISAGELVLESLYGPYLEVYDHLLLPFEIGDFERKLSNFITIHRQKKSLSLAQEELAHARLEVLEAKRLKREFMANVSHEIRTPMNGVIGMTGLLLETDLTHSQYECVKMIKTSSDNLMTLVSDLLDFSKLESGMLFLEEISFNLKTCFEELSVSLLKKAAKSQLTYELIIDPLVKCQLAGDPGLLRQVVGHLVDNAIKFTPKGGVAVRIEQELEDNEFVYLRFVVSDTGIGVAKENLDILFEPFTQGDGSSTRKYGGTGLGLSLSKKLVEKMGGDVGVESKSGKGASFWFTVKLKKQRSTKIDERVVVARTDCFRFKKIMVVDEDKTSRLLLKNVLHSEGLFYAKAFSGKGALLQLREAIVAGDPFDVVIMDMHLGEMTGEQLGTAIKADDSLGSLKMIMVTSAGERGDAARLENIGFDAYLTKPLNKELVCNCLIALSEDKAVAGNSYKIVTRHSIAEKKLGKTRIILADDQYETRIVGRSVIENRGFKVDVVANGKELVDALAARPYDLVLLACLMPEMSGYEATELIRGWRINQAGLEGERSAHLYRMSGVPIIAFTAGGFPGGLQKCLDAGMDDCIVKPVTPDKIINVIEKWFASGARVDDSLQVRGAVDNAKTMDWSELLDRSLGSQELAHGLLDAFFADVSIRVRELRAAVMRADGHEIIRLSNSIKGIAGTISARKIWNSATIVGSLAEAGDVREASLMVAKLSAQVEQLKNEIKIFHSPGGQL